MTDKVRRSLMISLQALNMENFFEVMIIGDEFTGPKPHLEGINKALDKLKISNEEAVFLGLVTEILSRVKMLVYILLGCIGYLIIKRLTLQLNLIINSIIRTNYLTIFN